MLQTFSDQLFIGAIKHKAEIYFKFDYKLNTDTRIYRNEFRQVLMFKKETVNMEFKKADTASAVYR